MTNDNQTKLGIGMGLYFVGLGTLANIAVELIGTWVVLEPIVGQTIFGVTIMVGGIAIMRKYAKP